MSDDGAKISLPESFDAFDVPIDPSPEESARQAGLRYVSDEAPGIRRKPWGRGFTYLDPEGEHVQDEQRRERLEALAIPPAWTDVWICPSPKGHIRATGRDEQGRKQYIYHPAWQQVRGEAKFNRTVVFGAVLPQLRARCEHDLRLDGLPRDKVLALVVRLLDRTLVRIGNREYAQANESYGLTTLRDRHVDFFKDGCVFIFDGKSGQEHEIELDDPRLAELVQACRDVPGYDLFQYYDDEGRHRAVDSGDVNAYLKETTGRPFTAKDFRTWGGTVHAALVLDDLGPPEDEKEAHQRIVEAGKVVAELLGNTPAVCREYYIHPAILRLYEAGELLDRWRPYLDDVLLPQLAPAEHATLHLLRDELAADS